MSDINSIKRLKEYPNYIITISGEIYSTKTKCKRIHKIDKQGYHLIGLWKNGTQHMELVHRLVMKTFKSIKNYDKLQVNHIDGNKNNNHLYNLEWVTDSENKQHAYNNGLKKSWNEKPCYAMKNNKLVYQFKNPYDAERVCGINHNTIYASIHYNRTCRNGLKWYRGIYNGEN